MIGRPAKSAGCLLVGALVLGFTGCGKKSNGVHVTGRVTYQGNPVSDAVLTLFPATGRPISASLSEQGNYEAELPPGDYVATVNIGTRLPPGYKEGDPLPPPKIVLPDQYTIRAKSTLKATVAADQSGPIDFELK
jgi:hypothetical protein